MTLLVLESRKGMGLMYEKVSIYNLRPGGKRAIYVLGAMGELIGDRFMNHGDEAADT